MTDQRDRNGRDDSAPLLQVVVPTHKPPIARVDVKPASFAARAGGNALQVHIDDTVMALVPTVNTSAERIDAVYLQLIVLSNAFNDLARRLSDTRAKVASSHDLTDASQKVDDAVEKVAEAVERLDELSEEIHTDHGVHGKKQSESERVRAAVRVLSIEDKAGLWDASVKRREKIVVGTIVGVLTVVVLAALGVAWRVAKAYDDGAAAEHARTPVRVVEVPALPLPPTAESPPPMLAAPPASAATVAPRRHQ